MFEDEMNRFHPSCAVTNIPMTPNARAVVFPMKKSPPGAYYNHDWYPASLPLPGQYNGDGAFEIDEIPDQDIAILERIHGPLQDPTCLDALSVSLFDLLVVHEAAWSTLLMYGCPALQRRDLDAKREALLPARASHSPDQEADVRENWLAAHLGLGFENTPWADLIWEDEDAALRFRDTVGRFSTATTTYGFRMLPALELTQWYESESWSQMILTMSGINDAARS
jgi:hypothetical protein